MRYNSWKFYFSYLFYKIFILPFQIKTPKLKFYVYELLYSFIKIFKKSYMLIYPFNDNVIITKYGIFYIRPKTIDAITVSPAYEYLDRKELFKRFKKFFKKRKKVLFVDIGANIGCYSIEVAKKFLNYDLLVLSVEASLFNYEILLKNIQINKLNHIIKAYNIALWDKDGITISIFHNDKVPGQTFVTEELGKEISVKTQTLESFLREFTNFFDILVIKIDVEGAEEKILSKGKNVFKEFEEVHLLIESFDDEKTISFLSTLEFKDFIRLTPYNIWAYME
ncbi:FkbM family methyltransferase [Thermodesulfovibrio yellowstonii]|uniref:Methyltransferase FkbM family protein n=1 Tax=Thermodesulfovibrio yellowstonii TaxID=28262 RepID=A0A9W6GHX5_9BACT|nr:FkbM family methyltransferase [Thermodesulfovibrio islandicus]GLI54224.1 methyltransferase FkbM family protein [Thermodesulfovibrio islandicus]